MRIAVPDEKGLSRLDTALTEVSRHPAWPGGGAGQ
jgi:hypothetical protein